MPPASELLGMETLVAEAGAREQHQQALKDAWVRGRPGAHGHTGPRSKAMKQS